jgi:hypothetical protein
MKHSANLENVILRSPASIKSSVKIQGQAPFASPTSPTHPPSQRPQKKRLVLFFIMASFAFHRSGVTPSKFNSDHPCFTVVDFHLQVNTLHSY